MTDDNSIMSFLQGASMNGRGNGDAICGNGFGLLIILFFLIFGGWGNAFGGRNNMNNIEGLDTILSGQNQIKNQMGYDTILNGVRGLERGMCDSTFALNNSITTGFAGVQNSLCQGFNSTNTALSNLGFNLAEKMNNIAANNNLQLQEIRNEQQSCCCQLKSEIASVKQEISSQFCSLKIQNLEKENQDLRDKLFEASQREQTTSIVAQLKTTTATAA